MNKNTSLSLLTKKQRRNAIDEIINYFDTEKDEEIGIIAAEDILDMFLQNIGRDLYNKGVDDAGSYYKDRFGEIEIDIQSIIKK